MVQILFQIYLGSPSVGPFPLNKSNLQHTEGKKKKKKKETCLTECRSALLCLPQQKLYAFWKKLNNYMDIL